MTTDKPLLRALAGERLAVPPVWLMRQAGRYLPEYRETRAKAGGFLNLCYTPELAAEVTLQPIRRFAFDGAILFADILLIGQALGAELWFETGEGPRMSTVTSGAQVAALRDTADIHETLAPVYETVRLVARELPPATTLIGFAGAPWTVATYMVAGRGKEEQAAAHEFKNRDRAGFQALIDKLTVATIDYLSAQITAGAEVVKLFDSWAGSLQGEDFTDFAQKPVARIIAELKSRHPSTPIIAFPREAGPRYQGFARATGADCVALDTAVDAAWAAEHLQPDSCVQGNLDPRHMVTGGPEMVAAAKNICRTFANGPHVFNLGHGITPDAEIDNVHRLLEAIRG